MRTLVLLLASVWLLAACTGGKGSDGPSFPPLDPSAPQVDRVGRPALSLLFNTVIDTSGGTARAFNESTPAADEAFEPVMAGLTARMHLCPTATVSSGLLPDVLSIDLSLPSGDGNGRAPEDDAIDQTLAALYTSGGTPCVPASLLTDRVDANDLPFEDAFPYFAPPH